MVTVARFAPRMSDISKAPNALHEEVMINHEIGDFYIKSPSGLTVSDEMITRLKHEVSKANTVARMNGITGTIYGGLNETPIKSTLNTPIELLSRTFNENFSNGFSVSLISDTVQLQDGFALPTYRKPRLDIEYVYETPDYTSLIPKLDIAITTGTIVSLQPMMAKDTFLVAVKDDPTFSVGIFRVSSVGLSFLAKAQLPKVGPSQLVDVCQYASVVRGDDSRFAVISPTKIYVMDFADNKISLLTSYRHGITDGNPVMTSVVGLTRTRYIIHVKTDNGSVLLLTQLRHGALEGIFALSTQDQLIDVRQFGQDTIVGHDGLNIIIYRITSNITQITKILGGANDAIHDIICMYPKITASTKNALRTWVFNIQVPSLTVTEVPVVNVGHYLGYADTYESLIAVNGQTDNNYSIYDNTKSPMVLRKMNSVNRFTMIQGNLFTLSNNKVVLYRSDKKIFLVNRGIQTLKRVISEEAYTLAFTNVRPKHLYETIKSITSVKASDTGNYTHVLYGILFTI